MPPNTLMRKTEIEQEAKSHEAAKIQSVTKADYEFVKSGEAYVGPASDGNSFANSPLMRIRFGQTSNLALESVSKIYYDSGSQYRDVVTRFEQMGFSVELPAGKTMATLAPLDKMPVGTSDYVVTSNAGGRLMLGKESSHAIIAGGSEIAGPNGVSFRLADVSTAAGSPAIFDVIKNGAPTGEQFQVSPGETLTYDDGSGSPVKLHIYSTKPGFTLESKGAEVAILSDEFAFEHGRRFNDASSTSPLKNWLVSMGGSSVKDCGNVEYDPDATRLYIYCDDVSSALGNENRVRPGGAVDFNFMPGLRGTLSTQWTLQDSDYADLRITAQDGRDLAVGKPDDPNVRDRVVSGNFIKLALDDPRGFNIRRFGQDMGDVGEVYLDPQSNGERIYAKFAGNQYYTEASSFSIRRLSAADKRGGWGAGFGTGEIDIAEQARPDGTRWPAGGAPATTFALTFQSTPQGYRFKASDTQTPSAYYLGLGDASSSWTQYELPVTTEAGSRITSIGMTDAAVKLATTIGQVRYSLSGPDVPTSVREYAPPTRERRSVLVYPNPTDGIATIAYQVPSDQVVSVKVYDMMGREVGAPISGERTMSGNHEMRFDFGQLASGAYLVKVQGQDGLLGSAQVVVRE